MADEFSRVSRVSPSGPAGDASQHITVNPNAFGAAEARGVEKLGEGIATAGAYFGDAAADDAVNKYQERIDGIMHGVPGRMVTGPDGKPAPDMGYMGLKGRKALDARADTDKQMDELRKEILGGLPSFQMKRKFDESSRRLKSYNEGKMGQHADTQANVWYDQVDKAATENWSNHIARNANDPSQVIEGREELRRIYVQRAERMGGGTELVKQSVEHADRVAVEAQASAIAVADPSKAMRIIENNRDALGTRYDELALRFRIRGEQQDGREYADRLLTGAPPPKGDDAHAVVRHFEGFREKAYMDSDGAYRVGYGSDTVMRADGRKEKVTPDTVVTRAEAEKDLEHRVGDFQRKFKGQVGSENWEKLSPRAKASLTSVVYNYGENWTALAPVIAAVKSGDESQVAGSIRSLAGHNNRVNSGRRASEASNIAPPSEQDRHRGTEAEMFEEIEQSGMPQDAKVAAKQRVGQSYRLERSEQTRSRTLFETKARDNEREALTVGAPSNPIPEADFVRQYGPQTGTVKFQEHQAKVQYGADLKTFETMPTQGINDVINTREADGRPGELGYNARMERVDRMRKAAQAVEAKRLDDPAESVRSLPVIREIERTFDPKNPETYEPVGRALLQAQEDIGIAPENRSPITKAGALQLMKPVQMALPGLRAQALEETGAKFRTMFGDNASQAFIYGLRAMKLSNETDIGAAKGVIDNLFAGRPVTQREIREAREAQQARDIEGALNAKAPKNDPPSWMFDPTGGYVAPPADPGRRPVPNSAAILDLRDNPQSAGDFDKTYGPGSAKKLMETYPAYFNKKGR